MAFRRIALLISGIFGGILAAALLVAAADGNLRAVTVHPAETHTDTQVRYPQPVHTQAVVFPVAVPGTALIAQRLSVYDGPFLEDESDREVVGVAALLVYNGGSREVLDAQITLHYGEVSYVFCGEHIPPGGMVVLLESSAKTHRRDIPKSCTGWQVTSQTAGLGKDQLAVTEKPMGELEVTNLTRTTLKNICIYYKCWLSTPDIYVGGKTYAVTVPVLLPGQTVYLYPGHYAAGYSKVVSVTADSTHSTALKSID